MAKTSTDSLFGHNGPADLALKILLVFKVLGSLLLEDREITNDKWRLPPTSWSDDLAKIAGTQ